MQKAFGLIKTNKFALYIKNKKVFMLKVNAISLFFLKPANIFNAYKLIAFISV